MSNAEAQVSKDAMEVNEPHDPVEESTDQRMSDVDAQYAAGNTSTNTQEEAFKADGEDEAEPSVKRIDAEGENREGAGFFRKKRKDMTEQEREEERIRKRDYKQRKRAGM